MKKVLTIITAFLLSLSMQAQNADLLNRIKSTNGKIKSFEADLDNTHVKSKKTTTQNGKLYFAKPKEFAALFSEDSYMIVNENKIKMRKNNLKRYSRKACAGAKIQHTHPFGKIQNLNQKQTIQKMLRLYLIPLCNRSQVHHLIPVVHHPVKLNQLTGLSVRE
jgi:Ser-tRNA(Ala) deacylase AlaX